MDDQPASNDTQRVRILSTLESSRRASAPGRPTRQNKSSDRSHRGSWLHGALWGAMGMGVLALTAGFVMVIQEPHAASPKPAVITPKPAQADQRTAQALSSHGPDQVSKDAPPAAGPAVIETQAPQAPLAALTSLNTPEAASAPTVVAKTAPAQATEHQPSKVKPPEVKAAAKPKAVQKGPDDDVALLEAMFAHTGGRATPLSARQDIQQRCGQFTGDEARACRTEVCRNHATSAICR